MGRASFDFEGLDAIEGRIRRLAKDIAYLAVSDRTERHHEEQLGRFDFVMRDALPYLEGAADVPEPSRNEQAHGLFGYEDDLPPEPDVEEEDDDEDAPSPPEDLDAIAEAGCRWLRDIAKRNTVGEPFRRFRVKAYGAKGIRVVDTASFVCKNVDHDLDLPMLANGSRQEVESDLRIPTPTFEDAAASGASRGIKALGDYYAQWGQIVLGSVGQLQGVNNAMLGRLHRQLQESRDQVDQLVAAILEFRVAELKLNDDRRADERSSDARADLARHALQQLGDAAKAFLATRGVPPELADVLGALGSSPTLVSALNEPDVRELIREPQNLELLAGLLRQAGAQARLLRDAMGSPTRAV